MVFVEDPWSRIVGVHWEDDEEPPDPGTGIPPLGMCLSGVLIPPPRVPSMNWFYNNSWYASRAWFGGTYMDPAMCCPPLPRGFNDSTYPPTWDYWTDYVPGNNSPHLKLTWVLEAGTLETPSSLYMGAWIYLNTHPYSPPIDVYLRPPDVVRHVVSGQNTVIVELDLLRPPAVSPKFGHTVIFAYAPPPGSLAAPSTTPSEPDDPAIPEPQLILPPGMPMPPPGPGAATHYYIIEHTCPDGPGGFPGDPASRSPFGWTQPRCGES